MPSDAVVEAVFDAGRRSSSPIASIFKKMLAIVLLIALAVIPLTLDSLGYGRRISSKIEGPYNLSAIHTGTISAASIVFMATFSVLFLLLSTLVSPRHKLRLQTAAFWSPVVISLLLFSPLGFQVLMVYMSVQGVLEYRDILSSQYISPSGREFSKVPICVAAFVVAASSLLRDMHAFSGALLATFGAMAVSYPSFCGANSKRFLCLDVLGVVYVAWLLSLIGYILRYPHGQGWLFLGISCSWIGDGGAYFIGSRWGRHKCLPLISPGKSWEGMVAEFFWTTATALFTYFLHLNRVSSLGLAPLEAKDYIPVCMALTFAGVAGDLCESFIKRLGNKKDSSFFFPGHGGILDRFDGFFFATIIISMYLIVYPSAQ